MQTSMMSQRLMQKQSAIRGFATCRRPASIVKMSNLSEAKSEAAATPPVPPEPKIFYSEFRSRTLARAFQNCLDHT